MKAVRSLRIVCLFCAACLMATAVFASEEPSAEATAAVEETVVPAADEAVPDEPPVPEPEDGDPMALRLAMQTDGGSKTFSDFTTRILDNETLRKGIDVSAWQGNINWQKVAESGVEFAIIRAAYRTYGSSGALYKDSYFDANMRGAKAAGIRVGVYIFSQAVNNEEAIREAEYLLELVDGYDIDLPLVFDFEYVSGGRLKDDLGKRWNTDMCLAFCRRVEEAGYDSMVYANASTLKGNLYPEEFSRIWLAHYTSQTSYSASPYEYWQCSGSGSVPGIEGDSDLDFWFEPDSTGLPFNDVKQSDWFFASVKQAFDQGIVNGVTKKYFRPSGTATRGQFTVMVHRMLGEPAFTEAAAFTDLAQDYYKNAIQWAAENKIVNGYTEEIFAPERAITREELVTILYRMKGEPETAGSLGDFADAGAVQAYAVAPMTWAVENGIVTGYEDNTLKPQDNATRAEVCTMLMRYAALPA